MAKSKPPEIAQASLFSLDRAAPDPFRKSVPLLHSKPDRDLSVTQRKAINALLKNAIEVTADSRGWFEISRGRLKRDLDYTSNNSAHLHAFLKDVQGVKFDWDVLASDDKKLLAKTSVLIPEIEVRTDSVRYMISPEILPQLLKPEVYAILDMTVMRQFRRSASVPLWEFCVRFERLGHTTTVRWEDLRDMIISKGSSKRYPEYKTFKYRILRGAIAEVSAVSDHTISLREIKDGRRVAGVFFDVQRKTVAGREVELDGAGIELVGKLRAFGIPPSEAKKAIKEFGVEKVERVVAYVRRRTQDKSQKAVKNAGAYFRTMLASSDLEVPADAPVKAAAEVPAVDIRALFSQKRREEAKQYFGELDPGEQSSLIDEYNGQAKSPQLQVQAGKRKVTALAETSFLAWIANQTWGEPTDSELLAFVQKSGLLRGG